MSTGINQKKQKNSIPVFLNYDNKANQDSILNHEYSKYKCVKNINSEVNANNSFYFGDNYDVLLYLYNNGYKGKIKLIYIDPPFATEASFINRDLKHAYSDNLSGAEYVEFLRKRLLLMKELLAADGSIYVHLDNKMVFKIKIIMDEIFGEKNFRAFITRKKCSTKNTTKKTYGNISDYIMFYSNGPKYTWNRPLVGWEYEKIIEQYPCIDKETGKRYKKVPIHAPGVRNGETGKEWREKLPPKGKHWQYTPAKLDELDANGEIYWSPSGNPRRKVYFDESTGIPMQDIWLDYRDFVNQSQKSTGYPTEKNLTMLETIINASSNNGDLVMDCFAGSGTTLEAASNLNRSWIGIDNSEESLKTIIDRFTIGVGKYGDYVNDNKEDKKISNKVNFSIYYKEDEKLNEK